jgi:hypothetical protein
MNVDRYPVFWVACRLFDDRWRIFTVEYLPKLRCDP